MAKEYWFCLIGPVERKLLNNNGADSPLRFAVTEKFEKMLPGVDYTCASGWGVSEKVARQIHAVMNKDFLDRHDVDIHGKKVKR